MKGVRRFCRIAVCGLLVASLMGANLPRVAFGDDWRESAIAGLAKHEEIFQEYLGEPSVNGYWTLIEDTGAQEKVIDLASYALDVLPSEDTYAQVLSELMALHQAGLANQIESQSATSDIKIPEVGETVADLAETVIGSTLPEGVNDLFDTAVSGAGTIVESANQAHFIEAIAQDYSESEAFLQAIVDSSSDAYLRSAARRLLRINESLLQERMRYCLDNWSRLSSFQADTFMKDYSMELLKKTDLYDDEGLMLLIDYGGKAAGALLSLGEFTFKGAILVGDIAFGTTNTFERYQEIKVLTHVAEALSSAADEIEVNPNDDDVAASYAAVQQKCAIYDLLITVHARGEYLLYQLVINESGILSCVQQIIDEFKDPDETTKAWYETRINMLEEQKSYVDLFTNKSGLLDDAAQEDGTEQEDDAAEDRSDDSDFTAEVVEETVTFASHSYAEQSPGPDTARTRSYPQFSGDEPSGALEDLNKRIKDEFDEMVEDARAWTSSDASMYTEEYNVDIAYCKDGIASVREERYEYGGGAHGMSAVTGSTYDLRTGEEVSVGKALGDGESGLSLASAAETGLREFFTEHPEEYSAGDPSTASFDDIVNDPDRYYITDDGVVFVTRPYEFGPYGNGWHEILVTSFKTADLLYQDVRDKYE